MAGDLGQFENLLQNLLCTDNNVRSTSEETYEGIPPVAKIPLLLQCMRNEATAVEVRVMAAVLLRRLFTGSFEEFWPNLPPEMQANLKEQLLIIVQTEKLPALKKKVCDCAAEFARCMIDDDGNNTWPDILKFLFDCASSDDPTLKESALQIFGIVPGIFGGQQNQYIDVIKQMLKGCVLDQNHPQVQVSAAKATMAFIVANEKETAIHNHYRDLVQPILQIIAASIESQEDDILLKSLVEVAETTPKFLRGQMEGLMALCLKVIGNGELQDSWRQLALEVVVTLSETAPAMVRKFQKYIPMLIPQILAFMVELEEDPEWATSDELEEDDYESNAIAGESALDRLACGLGGKTMLPVILANIPQMLQNSNWQYRHAALMAISACGEGCHKQMEQLLIQIVDAILPYLNDPHPRVRFAACNALGQMATDFGPVFQKKFHEKVVPALLHLMDDNANPRVQAHAGAALVNFSEDCPKGILAPYLDTIITKLEQVLTAKFKELVERGTKLVLEQVVTTLASVADTSEEKFIQYYDRFMPNLKYIVENANSQELRLLRGKTIECISLIGLAVGKNKFSQDCNDIMQLLLRTQTQQEELADDDPQISYMISAWARMCKILGKEFEQYLPMVMGPVIKAASLKPEVALVDSDDMKVLEGDTDWQFVTLGDQQSFGIRTAGLEEKSTACQMLVCYARELKEGFAEYTEQVVHLMVPLLKFYFHDNVRIAAAESMPYLLDCAKIRGPQYLSQMWQFICPELLKAIETEPENEVKPEHMHSLAQCIEKMGKNCVNEEQMVLIVQIIDKIMKEYFERQSERQNQRKDEDYDDIVEESLLDEDDDDVFILSKVSDIIHAFFGTHKEEFLPVFDRLLPHFTKLLEADRPWPDKQWGLCIFDDLLEHTGPHAMKYQQHFVPSLIHAIGDSHGEVRQAAAYGAGVMAQHGGKDFSSVLATDILPSLVKLIQAPESRSPENLNPTENAISAVTKICKYNNSNVDVNEILPHWLAWLPVWEDEEEAVHIYGYFCDLIEANNPIILGANNQNLPMLLKIMAETFVLEALALDEDVFKRMVNIIKQIQENGEMFMACVKELNEQQQRALSEALA